MAVSLLNKSEYSNKLGSVSEHRRDGLYGVGGSVLDLSLDVALAGEDLGEQSGVRGYLDLLGELRQ